MTPRRSFLQGAALTAASAARVLGANDRIRVGGVGTGGRGSSILRTAKEFGNVELVAFNDIHETRLEQARAQMSTGAKLYKDYRALLDDKDIDAVVVGAPDHWHVPMTIAAVKAGKDVYCEKPLTKTIEEGKSVIDAVTGSQRVVQVGYQQRSYPHFLQAREMVQSGKLGLVTLVHSWWNQNYNPGANGYSPATKPQVDATKIDWKQFLGTAPPRDFDPWRYTQWRFFWDYGGGTMTDLYSHWVDSIHWVMDDFTPISAQGYGTKRVVKHWEAPDTVTASYQYSKGFTSLYSSTMVTRIDDGGILFRGTGGALRLTRGGFEYRSEETAAAKRTSYAEPDLAVKPLREGTIDHVLNWLDCVRTRKQPNSHVVEAVAAANAAHWGNEAIRSGRLISLPPNATESRPLFNGRNLDGWVEDTPGVWSVRDGMLVGASAAGLKWNDFLRTREHYADFDLQLEFRLLNGIGNSGIQFRSIPVANSHEVAGYQADIGQQYWGALYDESRRKKVLVAPEAPMLEKLDRNAWHSYRVRAFGNHITLWLDGIRTVDYTEPELNLTPRGFLALQVHSGPPTEVHFRNIQLREL